ncbi:MAG: protein-disulfide reductase DsbD [Campylobacterota bacterium]|nr:protein-disulfide reductase DsbD [Campylobacterota bacterium]
MRKLSILLLFSVVLFAGLPKFMMPDEAFKPSAILNDKQEIEFFVDIAEDIYLYEDKLHVDDLDLDDDIVFKSVKMPTSVQHHDEMVFLDSPKIIVSLAKKGTQTGKKEINVSVSYQGCSEQGLCYEPITKSFTLEIDRNKLSEISNKQEISKPSTVENVQESVQVSSESDTIAQTLKEGSLGLIILSFLGFGLLLALTPCVFPMIPILSSVIVAQGKNITTRKAFMMSLVYVLAMSVAYTVAGVLAGMFGANLQAAFQTPWVIITFSLIFVALSLSMFDYYELQMPQFIQSRLNNVGQKQGGYLGVALMGFFSALIVGPCVAAPLAGALIYIGQTGDALLGGIALFALSMGMGLPLILVGVSAGKFMPKPGAWMDAIKSIFGVMLIGVAIWMISRILPESITLFLWSFLLIATAVNMGAFEPLHSNCPRCPKAITKSMGIIIFMYGASLFFGGISGAKDPLRPLSEFTAKQQLASMQSTQEASFQTIISLEELDVILKNSKGKKVMLDFYADWCVACKELEHNTFSDAKVKAKMSEFVLVKADVTANGDKEKALSKKYGVFGPPAILFFDENGKLVKGRTIIGYQDPEPFLEHLNKL